MAGGSILRDVLKVGQEIEIQPGLVSKDGEDKLTCRPIYSRIVFLFAEQNDLMYALSGGLIGVGTKVGNFQSFKRRSAKILQSRRMPLLEPSPG